MNMPQIDWPIALSWPQKDIAALCNEMGHFMKLDQTEDGTGRPLHGPQLMWAMAGNESSFGKNCTPRFEPAYFTGHYSTTDRQRKLNETYREYGACSWTPWQVMAIHAERFGFKLEELINLHKCGELFLLYMKHEILEHPIYPCRTLDQIGDAYNSGNWHDKNIPEKYIKDLKDNYFNHVLPAM
jgi:hypothetical protein